MEAKCMLCGKEFEGKEIVQLACVPVEWDEGLSNQWLFACWHHTGVEQEADTEETERFYMAEMREFIIPEFKVLEGWRK